jgi:hypothetical protein
MPHDQESEFVGFLPKVLINNSAINIDGHIWLRAGALHDGQSHVPINKTGLKMKILGAAQEFGAAATTGKNSKRSTPPSTAEISSGNSYQQGLIAVHLQCSTLPSGLSTFIYYSDALMDQKSAKPLYTLYPIAPNTVTSTTDEANDLYFLSAILFPNHSLTMITALGIATGMIEQLNRSRITDKQCYLPVPIFPMHHFNPIGVFLYLTKPIDQLSTHTRATLQEILQAGQVPAFPTPSDFPYDQFTNSSVEIRMYDDVPDLNNLLTTLYDPVHSQYYQVVLSIPRTSNEESKAVYSYRAISIFFETMTQGLQQDTFPCVCHHFNEGPNWFICLRALQPLMVIDATGNLIQPNSTIMLQGCLLAYTVHPGQGPHRNPLQRCLHSDALHLHNKYHYQYWMIIVKLYRGYVPDPLLYFCPEAIIAQALRLRREKPEVVPAHIQETLFIYI